MSTPNIQHVYIYMHILHVHDIDSTKETLSAKFYLGATWLQDKPKTADNPNWEKEMKDYGGANRTNFPVGIVDPKISFDNATSSFELSDESLLLSNPKFRVPKITNPDKIVVEWKATGNGTFIQSSLSFERYPFDIQCFQINMASKNPFVQLHDDRYDEVKSTMRMDYFIDTGFVPIEVVKNKIQDIKWRRGKSPSFLQSTIPRHVQKEMVARGSSLLSMEEQYFINPKNPQKKHFHLLSYVIPARRISRHAIEEMFIPIFLITTAVFTSYVVPPQDVTDRLANLLHLHLSLLSTNTLIRLCFIQ